MGRTLYLVKPDTRKRGRAEEGKLRRALRMAESELCRARIQVNRAIKTIRIALRSSR